MHTSQKEQNPFEDPQVAQAWIQSVEIEDEQKNASRNKYIYPLLQQWITEVSGKRILDIGAGQGIVSPFFTDKEYVGLEPSETLVQRANEKLAGTPFFRHLSVRF